MHDDGRNFDDLLERLSERVHAGPKGRLRLTASLRQLDTTVPSLKNAELNILDVGAGLGQVALAFAARGHSVTALDISRRMVDHIAATAQTEGLSLRCLHGSLQSRHAELSGEGRGYDVVCCHAALEWMRDPESCVALLRDLVVPGGALSLLFYNHAALVHRNLLRGNFNRARSPVRAGTEGGLTPSHPFDLQTVSDWLDAAGFERKTWFGVRAILDFLPPALVVSSTCISTFKK